MPDFTIEGAWTQTSNGGLFPLAEDADVDRILISIFNSTIHGEMNDTICAVVAFYINKKCMSLYIFTQLHMLHAFVIYPTVHSFLSSNNLHKVM